MSFNKKKYKLLDVNEAREILKQHQEYRLGLRELHDTPSVHDYSNAMFTAIAYLTELNALIDDMPEHIAVETIDHATAFFNACLGDMAQLEELA